ncbi:hypothetical protein Tsubulata_010460 [Turnera subulata]|uniref:AB hydrolase-1 domain-containing protein n=1 Tax=Turnera subulata TaxID=218843 RepID=A0A9Q0F2T6_9ROSI|nr:hypothetical protein Tsubulata_010460 [Turnera subulata]
MEVLSGNGAGIFEALNGKIYGNGTQTLILSHGFGTDQSVWHYLIPYLACYFKVVVFDLVFAPNVKPNLYDPVKYSNFDGYAADLVNLLDELELDKTIYMGHSMSAMIGCIAAVKRPELFQHLILLGGSPRYLNDTGYDGGFSKAGIEGLFDAMSKNYSAWVPGFAPTAVLADDCAAIAEFEDTLGRINPKVALAVAKTVFLSDLRGVLPKVLVPCTIIQAKIDPVAPTFVAHYMKRNLGAPATVKILKTKGHLPQLTAYPLLLKVLKKALPARVPILV